MWPHLSFRTDLECMEYSKSIPFITEQLIQPTTTTTNWKEKEVEKMTIEKYASFYWFIRYFPDFVQIEREKNALNYEFPIIKTFWIFNFQSRESGYGSNRSQ